MVEHWNCRGSLVINRNQKITKKERRPFPPHHNNRQHRLSTMTILSSLLLFSALTPLVFASPLDQRPLMKGPKPPTSLPVVLWHGLGDNYQGKGLADIAALINSTYPGTFVHSIYLDESPGEDRNKGFIGHLSDQVCLVTFTVNTRLKLCVSSWRLFQNYILDSMPWDLVKVVNS
jgi:hypothetical protein